MSKHFAKPLRKEIEFFSPSLPLVRILYGLKWRRKIDEDLNFIGGNLAQSGENYFRRKFGPAEIRSGGNSVRRKFGPAEIRSGGN